MLETTNRNVRIASVFYLVSYKHSCIVIIMLKSLLFPLLDGYFFNPEVRKKESRQYLIN